LSEPIALSKALQNYNPRDNPNQRLDDHQPKGKGCSANEPNVRAHVTLITEPPPQSIQHRDRRPVIIRKKIHALPEQDR
jgi:hypothetical protein